LCLLEFDNRGFTAYWRSMEIAVEIDDDLLKRAETKAAAENRTLSDVVEEGLRLVVARKLPRVSAQTGGLQPGVDLTRLSDYQEMEDLE
jgi:predicted transcriptional regulator